jgi:hypothetical protein
MAYATGQRRLLTSANATASATALAPRRYTEAELTSALANWKECVVAMRREANGPCARQVEVQLFGVGADNSTGSAYVWQLKRGRVGEDKFSDIELAYLGIIAGTLSTAVGRAASGVAILSSERIADTITWTPGTTSTTPKGFGTVIETQYGSPAAVAYSPADNTPGRVFIGECGGADILIECIKGTATSVNALVEVLDL